jgi:hypothetical protein
MGRPSEIEHLVVQARLPGKSLTIVADCVAEQIALSKFPEGISTLGLFIMFCDLPGNIWHVREIFVRKDPEVIINAARKLMRVHYGQSLG